MGKAQDKKDHLESILEHVEASGAAWIARGGDSWEEMRLAFAKLDVDTLFKLEDVLSLLRRCDHIFGGREEGGGSLGRPKAKRPVGGKPIATRTQAKKEGASWIKVEIAHPDGARYVLEGAATRKHANRVILFADSEDAPAASNGKRSK